VGEVKTGLPALPMMDVYDLVDVKDIVEHLRKAVTKKWAYEITFNKGTEKQKIVRGLGITGSMETAVIIAKLSKGQHVIRPLELLKLEETAETWDAVVRAGLYVVGIIDGKSVELLLNTSLGYCNQPKMGVRKDGSTWIIEQPDKLAASKAQRMAVEKLIPDKWKITIIDVAIKEGKIQREDEENSPSGGEGKSNGKDASKKQTDAIEKMIMNKHVDDATATHYKGALNKGMTMLQASRAIQTLSKIIEAGKEKNADRQTLV